jgi:DNA replicative helicase MCM subunit Mcm2 (Cdc46/Mcm family)
MRAAVAHAERVQLMTRDDAAAALWAQIYPRLSTGRPSLFGAVTARAEAQVMRLALLYALADCAEAIEREHLEAALEVWRYCFDSAAYIFGTRLGDTTADRILEALRDAGAEGLRRWAISNVFDGHKSTAEIERALNLLATYGLAEKDLVETAGRPSERWRAC